MPGFGSGTTREVGETASSMAERRALSDDRGPSGVTLPLAFELRDAGKRRALCLTEEERATLEAFIDCAASSARPSGNDTGRLTLRSCSMIEGLIWYEARGRRFGRGGDTTVSAVLIDAGSDWRLRAEAEGVRTFVAASDRVLESRRSSCESIEPTGAVRRRGDSESGCLADWGLAAAGAFLMSAKRKDGSLEELWLWRCECKFDEGPVMEAGGAASVLPGRLAAVELA